MFNKHLFTVILGFCAMILLGLITLTVIDSMNRNQTADTAMEKASQQPPQESSGKPSGSIVLPQIKGNTATKTSVKKS